jgi:hypothetical protein
MGCSASKLNDKSKALEPAKFPILGGDSKKRTSSVCTGNSDNLDGLPGPVGYRRDFLKRSFLANAYVKNDLEMNRVTKEDVDELVDAMHELRYTPGKLLFKAGTLFLFKLLPYGILYIAFIRGSKR